MDDNRFTGPSSSPADQSSSWGHLAWRLLSSLRSRAPLVHCMTNLVSMDMMANTLLAAGASPAMVHSVDEIPDFAPHTDALLVNVGTLDAGWLPSMRRAAEEAGRKVGGRPWVLDPVAASVSQFRMEACLGLLDLRPTVVRGNASEILALTNAGRLQENKGTDSSHDSSAALCSAKSLASSTGSVVAISGAVDYITDGRHTLAVHNGVPMLQKITATGCAVTALIAAFVAVADDGAALEAAACALAVFGLAAELGSRDARGPASLRVNMIDELHGLDEEKVVAGVRIECVS